MVILGSFDIFLVRVWPVWGPLWLSWGSVGTVTLGTFSDHFGSFCALLGPFTKWFGVILGTFGLFGPILDNIWHFGHFDIFLVAWDHFGSFSDHFGHVRGHFGVSLGHYRDFWTILGFWCHFGTSLGDFKVILGPFGVNSKGLCNSCSPRNRTAARQVHPWDTAESRVT